MTTAAWVTPVAVARHNRRVIDINGSEFLIIAVLAVILVGPERLPEYVRGLRTVVRRVRAIVADGQHALRQEWGDDVDWDALDPRTYDPRRIVRDALLEGDEQDASGQAQRSAVPAAMRPRAEASSAGAATEAAPYDPETT